MADDGTIMRLASGNLVLINVLRCFPLKHPTDHYARKKFDNQYLEFASDP